jgi:hypothetical protein
VDRYFDHFLKSFGPAFDRREVPSSSIDRFRGKLPEQLLAYWQEHGWCGYADGLLWTVDPEEYEPVVQAWIGKTRFMQEETFHIIARSAFGKLYFWGEQSGGDKLNIIAPDSFALSRACLPAKDLDHAARVFFGAKSRDAADYEADEGPLFAPALATLGRLAHDEMYGFVPALALGGAPALQNLQKVDAVAHLILLAQFAPLRGMQT